MSSALLDEAEALLTSEELDADRVVALAMAVRSGATALSPVELQALIEQVNALTLRLQQECDALKGQLRGAAQHQQRARGYGWSGAQLDSQRVHKKV